MSITPLCKLRMVGLAGEKDAVLNELQDLGCLMLVPMHVSGESQAGAPHRQLQEALTFLLSCPRRRPQVHDATEFHAERVKEEALSVMRRLQALQDERDALVQRLRDLEPWGDFAFPPQADLGGQHLWFYAVPHVLLTRVASLGLPWTLNHRDAKNSYITVIAPDEPAGMPVPRVHSGSQSPEALRKRLEEVRQQIEDAHEARYSLTRWCDLFVHHLNLLEDRAARDEAARQMLDAQPLFGLEAWTPVERLADVRRCLESHGVAVQVLEPTEADNPPTLMKNPTGLDAGEALVTFYMTPGYWTWDPSPVVLFSFAVFFAMILSDAGYAALMGLLLAYIWRRTGRTASGRRMRTLLGLLTGASLIYGVMVGSYFGVAPSEQSLPGRLAFLNVNDADTMMGLSVVIGVLHLVAANLMNARRYRFRLEALAPLGWAGMMLGGFFAAAAGTVDIPALRTAGLALLVIGAGLVLLFSGVGKKPMARAVSGLLAFTKVTAAFGDVLSYLRLFALGLASASLAVAFNDMAGQIRSGLPGIGLLLALLILVIGHGLNMVLSLSSAVIHGLRLNVIEFFNWGLPEEGTPYRTFAKKEPRSWNP